jgi:AcrR family transcriptional regulator
LGTAWRLFADRGFDKVTVARSRGSAGRQATVFNYFPSKEDLFCSRFEAFSPAGRCRRDRSRQWPSAFRRALLEGGLLAQGRPATRRPSPGSARSTG